jgi:predicted lipoprotein with Yx(FWY)xxD motif
MLKSCLRVIFVAAAVSGLAATFAYAAMPAMTAQTGLGPTLVDSKGMTLYTFDKDMDGKSACVAKCATNWPPLMAAKDDKAMGAYTLITRDDGTMQWAYKGKPLYTWAKDMKPGDTTGDGFLNGAWHAAKP